MEVQDMSVAYLRFALRKRKDLQNAHGLTGTDIVRLNKEQLVNIFEGVPAGDFDLTPREGDNGDLASIIARAISGHLDITPDLDTDAVQEMIDKSLTERLQVRPIIIENRTNGTQKDIGIQHAQFENILKLVSMRIDIMLVGPAASGKTTACENVASALDLPFYFIPVGLQTTKSDLLGYMNANGEYVKTHLRQAYEHGGVFLLDEIDAGNPNVLTVINGMLANGIGSFPDAIIKRHADFIFICAGNTWGKGADRQYVGRNPIDASTMDRFAALNFDYDEALEKALSNNHGWLNRVQDIRVAVELLKEKVIVSPRAIIKGEQALTIGFTVSQCEDMFIFRGINPDVKNRVLAQVNGV